MNRITSAEVRNITNWMDQEGRSIEVEVGGDAGDPWYALGARLRRLADQMDADEKRMKGRVLVPVETWQRPVDGKYVAYLMFWDERDVGDTTEEAIANLQAALDKEE